MIINLDILILPNLDILILSYRKKKVSGWNILKKKKGSPKKGKDNRKVLYVQENK